MVADWVGPYLNKDYSGGDWSDREPKKQTYFSSTLVSLYGHPMVKVPDGWVAAFIGGMRNGFVIANVSY